MLGQIIGGLSVLLTAIYAWLTYQILRANRDTVLAMQEQNALLNRPYIVISATPEPGTIVFLLRIANVGRSPAQNLRLTLDRAVHQFGNSLEEKDLRSLHAFSNSIPVFAPGTEVSFHLGTSIQIFGGGTEVPLPQVFNVTARYSSGASSFEETTTIDLRSYFNSAVIETAEAKALSKIAEHLQRLNDRR